jgi:hypothetical protein
MLYVKGCLVRTIACIALLSAFIVLAQDAKHELPLVIGGKMPLYPIMARTARIEGIVKVRVTTDGEKVGSIQAESGPPMLVRFVKENVLTWEFTKHNPTTFVTTFEFVLEGPDQCSYSNGVSVLRLPLEARISAHALKTCDPAEPQHGP